MTGQRQELDDPSFRDRGNLAGCRGVAGRDAQEPPLSWAVRGRCEAGDFLVIAMVDIGDGADETSAVALIDLTVDFPLVPVMPTNVAGVSDAKSDVLISTGMLFFLASAI